MPKRIILLRHGETDYNLKDIIQGQTDVPLNKKGLEQAKKAAAKLKKEEIDAIFSSDLKRARQTAEFVAAHFKLPIIKTSKLRERYLGKLEKRKSAEVEKAYGLKKLFSEFWDFNAGSKNESLKIERVADIEKKLRSFFDELKKYKDRTVLVVSHGGTMRRILTMMGHDIGFVKKLQIKNTAILHLIKEKGGYKLKA